MLLSITLTHRPATDLGFLLHKNPAKLQAFEQSFGRAYVIYPEANDERCTMTFVVDVDPVRLVRRRSSGSFVFEQYVNDRPYSANSFLSVAITNVFGTALAGRCSQRPELVETKLPFCAELPVVPCRGGEATLRRIFEPLGYVVTARQLPLDEKFPEWGESRYFSLKLEANITLHDLLSHLYVLIPALDGEKHYWIGDDEVEKLLRHGAGWLASHPEKDFIVKRYLFRSSHLANDALDRLMSQSAPAEVVDEPDDEPAEPSRRLNDLRHDAVIEALKTSGAKRVLDLGCSTGTLLKRLLKEKQFEQIVGMDVSHQSLEIASDRLKLQQMSDRQRERITLIHGSLMYRDKRLIGFDAAAVVEVIEHLDAPRLAAFERVLFEFARPQTVVLTTPNIEYNVRFPTLAAGKFRHADHRFEWTRAEFTTWCERISSRFGYVVSIHPVGEIDPQVGAPTQLALFKIGGGQ